MATQVSLNSGAVSSAGSLKLQTNGTTDAVTIDTAQNMGLGVAPSAWGTANSVKALQTPAGVLWNYTSGNLYLGQNYYFNGSNRIYLNNTAASEYQQNAGAHYWYTAPSGTAGNAITFTQAMTLDASGRLGIGRTSPSQQLDVNGQILATNIYLNSDDSDISWNSGSGSRPLIRGNTTNNTIQFFTASQDRARIDSSGNLLVGRTDNPNAVSNNIYCPGTYNNTSGVSANVAINSYGLFLRATSSLKYKNNVQDATHGLADVLKLRAVTYKSNREEESALTFGGLIAEEVHEAGLTEFVQYAEDGTPDALAYGNMVSLAFKAIQEQQAIITSLTERITALEAK